MFLSLSYRSLYVNIQYQNQHTMEIRVSWRKLGSYGCTFYIPSLCTTIGYDVRRILVYNAQRGVYQYLL